MKKILILTIAMLCIMCMSSYAATGDIKDHIYSTDIRAFINSVEVESYAIGGKTVVVVEDVTEDYDYNDYMRTLLVGGFAPYNLKEGEAEHSSAPGKIIGNVYDTDIHTYIYDTELNAYALNGKTAVAIEDLGGDQAWSELGGKYKWDPDARTISLETICSSSLTRRLLGDKNIRITVNEDKTEANAEFYFDKLSVGGSVDIMNGFESDKSIIVPIYTTINGEKKQLGNLILSGKLYFDIAGYNMGNGEIRYGGDVTGGQPIYKLSRVPVVSWRFDDEITAEGAASIEIEELTPVEKVLKDYITMHACTIIDRYDAQDYTFVYMSGSTPHGSTDIIMRIKADGTYSNYSDEFESVSFYGTKHFDNVKIDRENENVSFRYDTDYVIDLKTGVMAK